MASCPRGMVIQTVLVSRAVFTFLKAKSWVTRHHFVAKKVDTTEGYFRFRQHDPSLFDHRTFRTITLTTGVSAVVACPSAEVKAYLRRRP